jgi:hypothetical protein
VYNNNYSKINKVKFKWETLVAELKISEQKSTVELNEPNYVMFLFC